ncbi:MAG: hypothetical protein IIZ88_07270 [Prevotella sp.]|nr:hypothetical protein [Prevotella sp.]
MKKSILFSMALVGLLSMSPAVSFAQDNCDYCKGSGKEYRTCAFCQGEGYRECDFCLGKKMVRCNDCGGEGKVFCAHCRGKGGVQIKDEWRECQWCGGQGTPDCERCKTTGSIVCWKCEGAGKYVCNQCNGSKVNEWSCTHCQGTGKKAQANADTPPISTQGYSGKLDVKREEGESDRDLMIKIAKARLAHRKKQMEAQGITVK